MTAPSAGPSEAALAAARQFLRDHPPQFGPLTEGDKEQIAEWLAPHLGELRECLRELAEGLSWALDLLDMYDQQLINLGEPVEKVNPPIHLEAKSKARAALERAEHILGRTSSSKKEKL